MFEKCIKREPKRNPFSVKCLYSSFIYRPSNRLHSSIKLLTTLWLNIIHSRVNSNNETGKIWVEKLCKGLAFRLVIQPVRDIRYWSIHSYFDSFSLSLSRPVSHIDDLTSDCIFNCSIPIHVICLYLAFWLFWGAHLSRVRRCNLCVVFRWLSFFSFSHFAANWFST